MLQPVSPLLQFLQGTLNILKGDYDAETDTLTASGGFDNEEPFTVTFSFDENGNIVWTENGESAVLEYSYQTD